MPDASLLDALLDSWDRNKAIMLNLPRAVPDDGLDVKAAESSPTVGQQFMHMHQLQELNCSPARLLKVTLKIEGGRMLGGGPTISPVYDQEPRRALLE